MFISRRLMEPVVFISYIDDTGEQRLAGTAFWLAVPLGDTGRHAPYLTTARHVIERAMDRAQDRVLYARCNIVDEGVQLVDLPAGCWRFHPTDHSVDVAVANVVAGPRVESTPIGHDLALTAEIMATEHIGVGTGVFAIGLFTGHYGDRWNRPIVRTGTIAMLAERIQTQFSGSMEAHLVEIRSTGGLSGSPVFVDLSDDRVVEGADGKAKRVRGAPMPYLLGLMHGHWDLPRQSAVAGGRRADGAPAPDRLNTGIAVVVPAEKILEVINQPFFEDKRARGLARLLERQQGGSDEEER